MLDIIVKVLQIAASLLTIVKLLKEDLNKEK